ncbi:MAG: S-methyl-5-thioribose-1-phosphate isomerase [Candidatus Aenigmatarchaeota archaeon]
MKNLETVEKNLKKLKIQGAREIALYSLKFLKDFCKKNGFGLKFEVAAMILERARPTAVVLHNCLEIIKKNKKMSTIDKLIKQLENSTKKIEKIGQKVIPREAKIMTHCHSGEALAVIKYANKIGKKISVIATETEPLQQGIKTVKEMAREKIPITLITDNAVGFFMKEVDMVIVGTDAMRKEGFVNKIGTLNLALAAKNFGKKFYVVGNKLKLDRREKLVIEERPPEEVYHRLLHPGKLTGVKIRNPAFDIVPWKFVTRIITDEGIKTPEQIIKMIKGEG